MFGEDAKIVFDLAKHLFVGSPTRSILLTASTTWRMPSSDTISAWRCVCASMPLRASTSSTARSAFEAPVAMLRVYCSWPGVSATMNLRLSVAK